jgi:hypothetical protein
MQPDNEFLQKNFQYFQEWHHWHDKAVSLRRAALVLYRNSIPELRKYDTVYRAAQKELKKRPVVPIRYPHPDMLPAFSIYGSALENAFKGIIVSKNKELIGANRVSKSLQEHNLIKLARSAGVSLSRTEEYVLEWVTEVLIWKARYSVPITIDRPAHFFHKLDDVRLTSARTCIKALDRVFARAKRAMPRRVRRIKFDVLVDFSRGP